MAEKRITGFVTSATRMQEKLDEMNKLLDSKQAEWGQIIELASKHESEARQYLATHLKSGKRPADMTAFLHREITVLSMTRLIGKLGLDIVELTKELAKVDKTVRELKARLK